MSMKKTGHALARRRKKPQMVASADNVNSRVRCHRCHSSHLQLIYSREKGQATRNPKATQVRPRENRSSFILRGPRPSTLAASEQMKSLARSTVYASFVTWLTIERFRETLEWDGSSVCLNHSGLMSPWYNFSRKLPRSQACARPSISSCVPSTACPTSWAASSLN